MKWSWHIGRVAGVNIYLHATLLILVAWIGYEYYAWRHQVRDVIEGTLFIVCFFGIVLLHELGHALAARHYHIRTPDITLLPIGGLARMERMPERPHQELMVALAGPAVNVLLALVYWGTISPLSVLVPPQDFRWVGGHFLEKLVWTNVAMAAFNLMPAFPMDGGRVLRALLAMRLGYTRATRWAADIGQVMAFAFGALGLYAMHPLWVFIALFVYLGAEQEAEIVRVKSALAGVPIQRVMITDFRSLAPQDLLQRAVEHTLAGFQQDFPVLDGGRVVGVLTRRDLIAALTRRGQAAPVAEAMRREFQTASPEEEAETVFARLDAAGCHSLPVVEHDRLVGIVTAEIVGEYLMIQSALRGERPAKSLA
jgi:Zn-dependent protease/predicted transcriptional regulator